MLLNVITYYVGVAVRLVNGRSFNEGRVELNYNGVWGTVCDDGWSSSDAYVVCRQLGFGPGSSYFRRAYFGQGSGPIWLDNVQCTGSELTLASCSHLGFNVTRSCSHSEDVGVRCYGTQGIAFKLTGCFIYIITLYIILSCIDICT